MDPLWEGFTTPLHHLLLFLGSGHLSLLPLSGTSCHSNPCGPGTAHRPFWCRCVLSSIDSVFKSPLLKHIARHGDRCKYQASSMEAVSDETPTQAAASPVNWANLTTLVASSAFLRPVRLTPGACGWSGGDTIASTVRVFRSCDWSRCADFAPKPGKPSYRNHTGGCASLSRSMVPNSSQAEASQSTHGPRANRVLGPPGLAQDHL